jgi:arginine utilization regulatory protein
MFLQQVGTEEMVKAILSSIDEAIHAVDNNGVTIFYNEVAAKHDGVTIDEVLGKHILEVFPSLTSDTSTLLKVIETKEPIYHLPQTYKNVRGEIIDTINTTLPIMVQNRLIGAVEIGKDYSQIKTLSNKLIDLQIKLKKKTQKPQEVNGARYTMNDILTSCETLKIVKRQALKVAKTSSTVLVYGETGTGKELLVQAVHNSSSRKSEAFIAQSCASIPESLLESLLFGTVKGSYTGAVDRAGLFELAHGGTLFLDEMNSMPLELQAKLLRVLEDGVVRRVGSTKEFKVDVRVIVAMNEEPVRCLQENRLRPDLFYRLNVFSLHIPPLRERVQDIELLIGHFITQFNQLFGKRVNGLKEDVGKVLTSYRWPGNVRELKHTIEHAMNMAEDEMITLADLPYHLPGQVNSKRIQHEVNLGEKSLRKMLSTYERSIINQALTKTDGNIKQAAELLKIPRQTLQYKMSKFEAAK